MPLEHYEVLPDEQDKISLLLIEWIDFLICLSLYWRDGVRPKIYHNGSNTSGIEKGGSPDISETIRRYGKDLTPYAMISREVSGIKKTLIIYLPGSPRGVQERMEALFLGLLHTFPLLWGKGH